MIDIEIDLPMPPSVNAVWRSVGGKVIKAKAYRKWIEKADAICLAQPGWRNKTIRGRYSVLLILNETMMRINSDGDNRLKVPLDYAKRLGLIVDDSIKYAREWHIKLGDDSNAPAGARLILRSAQ